MDKLTKVREILKQQNLDAIVILSDYNRRYLSGFTGTSGALVITSTQNQLITDFRYIEQATNQATNFEIVNRSEGLIDEIKSIITKLNLQRVGFEGHLISYDTYQSLNKTSATLISIGEVIEEIRQIKSPEEIEKIKYAAKIVDDTYNYILEVAKAGMTEKELKALLESKMLHLGAEGPSFDTIVASGYRGALPHGVASDKVIEQGDMITLDFGAYYEGYCSDITRTFAIGEPDPKMKEIYNIVLESQIKAINEIKPGMTVQEADALSRDYIDAHGYCQEFGHSLGHGIGLDIHEGPLLSKNAKGTIQVNNCVTIEPGIYVDGLGGVRIEDDILITENGCEVFTKCTKDLIILK
ncbi:aminopeptidase P family protein [Staphylococcus devriesei]|uniref:Aminopeptidase P family protein n=1 Tax=Staphylococcus devriesei TaxID=586733 RepID=A0A2K4DQF7_9STAP|nr:Xaa-Pro peptidase family protein [Staphylococcus devriesei]MCE5089768.1 aminopeptidase P family protein [Staphylococcus devriesei]MCE5097451.1 aminopeptidase P family protein [Staphylococcus devriesei]PNZ89041.1 peptidase M24 family protein [Staphylococcus devriesei]PTE73975.1 aminopeptidase P family protein [Staphylococcus devriesei]PTF03334.1 aminopeptidase P family protein [Staphylococcus devriesei]